MQRIGKYASLYSTGVGKILLINYSDKKLDMLIAKNYYNSLLSVP